MYKPPTLLWLFNVVLLLFLGYSYISKKSASQRKTINAEQNQSALSRTSRGDTIQFNKETLLERASSTRSWDELREVALETSERFGLKTPEGQEEFRKFVAELAAEDPSQALDFLAFSWNYQISRKLEAEIVSDWVTQDAKAAFAYYEEKADQMDPRLAGHLVKAFATKSGDDVANFFSWFDSLSSSDSDDSGDKKLVQAFIGSQFASNLEASQFPQGLTALMNQEDNPAVQAHLTEVLSMYGIKAPNEAVSWVKENRDNLSLDIYNQALDSLLDRWGAGNDPNLASEFLSRDDFYTQFYRQPREEMSPQEIEKDQKDFFDQRLVALLESLLAHYPEDSYYNASLFHDPKLKEQYMARSADMVPALNEVLHPNEN